MLSIKTRVKRLVDRKRLAFKNKPPGDGRNPFTGKPGHRKKDPFPPGIDGEVLLAFEQRTGVALPNDLQEWLRISNGAAGFFGVTTDEDRDIETTWTLFPEWQAKHWIPVGRDGSGNYYLRVIGDEKEDSGAVCFIEAIGDGQLAYAVASDTLHFAAFELAERTESKAGERYGWPFDRAFVLAKDSAMANVTVAPLPWELSKE